jgi:glyoxylase-like metal-dependent hydrolase (beta-lactamase superfamily II)
MHLRAGEPMGAAAFRGCASPAAGKPGGRGRKPVLTDPALTCICYLVTGQDLTSELDALMTNDPADSLAEWAKGFDKRLTGVYITHGHSDHWLGLARLVEHFPEACGFATAEVTSRAAFEADSNRTSLYWISRFPRTARDSRTAPRY